MSDPSDAQYAYVDAAARVLGLPIAPWRDGVASHFAVVASMNAIVDAFPLDVRDESGSVFVPVPPDHA
jgi:hypothetical protein